MSSSRISDMSHPSCSCDGATVDAPMSIDGSIRVLVAFDRPSIVRLLGLVLLDRVRQEREASASASSACGRRRRRPPCPPSSPPPLTSVIDAVGQADLDRDRPDELALADPERRPRSRRRRCELGRPSAGGRRGGREPRANSSRRLGRDVLGRGLPAQGGVGHEQDALPLLDLELEAGRQVGQELAAGVVDRRRPRCRSRRSGSCWR